VVYHLTASFTDTQQTNAVVHTASALKYIRPGVTAPKSSIVSTKYNSAVSGVVNFAYDNATGNLLASTTGFTTGQSYDITLTLRKEPSDVSTAPNVTALTMVDAHSGIYVTGDTLRVKATFDQVIYVESAHSYIKFSLDSGDIYARYRGNQTVSAVKTGSGTLYAVFEYTFKATDGASAGYMSVTHIDNTIFGSDVGHLSVRDVLPAITGIANFTVNEKTGVLKTQTGKTRITVRTTKTLTGTTNIAGA